MLLVTLSDASDVVRYYGFVVASHSENAFDVVVAMKKIRCCLLQAKAFDVTCHSRMLGRLQLFKFKN